MYDTLSTEYGSSEPHPTFPYRPRPKDRRRSPDLQRKSHIRELADSIAWLRSLRAIPRVIVVVAPFMCLVAASMFFGPSACAQNASRSPSIDRFANFVTEASTRFAVPARWIRSVIQVESAGDERAISPRGAMGLMQLMPGTWVELSIRYELGVDPSDPRDNILAGTAYLRELHDRFGSAGFLAAYHAVRRDMNSTSQQVNHFHRKPRPTLPRSRHCWTTSRVNMPQLAAGVHFLGWRLPCLLSGQAHRDGHSVCIRKAATRS
jgi:soluble lytic murein transglycosylase-like protein